MRTWRSFGVLALVAGPTLPLWWLFLLTDVDSAAMWLAGVVLHAVLVVAALIALSLLDAPVLAYRVGWMLVAVAAVVDAAALLVAWLDVVDGGIAFAAVAFGWALQGIGLTSVGWVGHSLSDARSMRALLYAGIGWLMVVGLWFQPSQIVVLAGGVVVVGWAYSAIESLGKASLLRST